MQFIGIICRFWAANMENLALQQYTHTTKRKGKKQKTPKPNVITFGNAHMCVHLHTIFEAADKQQFDASVCCSESKIQYFPKCLYKSPQYANLVWSTHRWRYMHLTNCTHSDSAHEKEEEENAECVAQPKCCNVDKICVFCYELSSVNEYSWHCNVQHKTWFWLLSLMSFFYCFSVHVSFQCKFSDTRMKWVSLGLVSGHSMCRN